MTINDMLHVTDVSTDTFLITISIVNEVYTTSFGSMPTGLIIIMKQ